MPSPLKLHTWQLGDETISAFGLDKQDAIKSALIGVPSSKVELLRERLTNNQCSVKDSNIRR